MNPRYQLSGRDRELTIHDRDGIFAPAVDDSTLGIAFELSEVIRDKWRPGRMSRPMADMLKRQTVPAIR